jgi:protein SCO1/2
MMRAVFGRHLATLVAALMLAAGPGAHAATPFNGTDISHARSYAQDFRLTDHDGRTRSLADFRGKAVVLFFGYLQCPNFCPVTLARLAETMQLLGDDAKRVQVLFVTLDPERDLPQALKEYVTNFHPTFLGLYAAPGATADLALKFRIYYEKVPGPTATSYNIDHSVFSYAYDTRGRLRLFLKDSLSAAELAADLRRLAAP